MIAAIFKATGWLLAVLAIVALYVGFFVIGHASSSRGWWIELGALLGFVLLGLLSIQFVTNGRFWHLGKPFGTDIVLWFHKQAGILLLLLLLAHPVILLTVEPDYVRYFDPRVNAPRAIFLILATMAMVLLVVLSLWRPKFGLSYEVWRISHAVMAAGVVFIGCAHAWQVGHYVDGTLKRTVLVLTGLTAIGLLSWVRIWRPWMMKSKPYRVTETHDNLGDTTTLVLQPEGHHGMNFLAGQYAWFTFGDTPFSLQQHPFSFSSSDQACPDSLSISVKKLGDFSGSLQNVKVGTKVFVEGPYGRFTLDENASGAVFIMGGIGITPAISMLCSLRDRRDRRPLLLIYGNTDWQEAAFRTDLKQLEKELELTVVHVLENPPADWEGESGLINIDLLKRHITKQRHQHSYYLCGPEPLMDAVEPALREIGIPWWRVRAERFTMV